MTLSRPFAYLFLFAAMALIGIYVALSKPLTAALPVALLATLRFAFAALLMLPWTWPRTHPGAPATPWATLWLQSFFGNFLFSVCMLLGVSMTSATAAGMILSTLPAVVALFSRLFLGERLSAPAVAAIVLAGAGMAVLQAAQPAADAGSRQTLGNLLVFGAVCCEAVYVIVGKRLTASLSAMRISALINLCGLAFMLPWGVWQAWGFDFAGVAPAIWGWLAFYAISASIVSTWLWLTGLKTVPASHAGVFTVALPLASSVVGMVFLGERFTLAHAVAFACAAAGVLLISLPRRR